MPRNGNRDGLLNGKAIEPLSNDPAVEEKELLEKLRIGNHLIYNRIKHTLSKHQIERFYKLTDELQKQDMLERHLKRLHKKELQKRYQRMIKIEKRLQMLDNLQSQHNTHHSDKPGDTPMSLIPNTNANEESDVKMNNNNNNETTHSNSHESDNNDNTNINDANGNSGDDHNKPASPGNDELFNNILNEDNSDNNNSGSDDDDSKETHLYIKPFQKDSDKEQTHYVSNIQDHWEMWHYMNVTKDCLYLKRLLSKKVLFEKEWSLFLVGLIVNSQNYMLDILADFYQDHMMEVRRAFKHVLLKDNETNKNVDEQPNVYVQMMDLTLKEWENIVIDFKVKYIVQLDSVEPCPITIEKAELIERIGNVMDYSALQQKRQKEQLQELMQRKIKENEEVIIRRMQNTTGNPNNSGTGTGIDAATLLGIDRTTLGTGNGNSNNLAHTPNSHNTHGLGNVGNTQIRNGQVPGQTTFPPMYTRPDPTNTEILKDAFKAKIELNAPWSSTFVVEKKVLWMIRMQQWYQELKEYDKDKTMTDQQIIARIMKNFDASSIQLWNAFEPENPITTMDDWFKKFIKIFDFEKAVSKYYHKTINFIHKDTTTLKTIVSNFRTQVSNLNKLIDALNDETLWGKYRLDKSKYYDYCYKHINSKVKTVLKEMSVDIWFNQSQYPELKELAKKDPTFDLNAKFMDVNTKTLDFLDFVAKQVFARRQMIHKDTKTPAESIDEILKLPIQAPKKSKTDKRTDIGNAILPLQARLGASAGGGHKPFKRDKTGHGYPRAGDHSSGKPKRPPTVPKRNGKGNGKGKNKRTKTPKKGKKGFRKKVIDKGYYTPEEKEHYRKIDYTIPFYNKYNNVHACFSKGKCYICGKDGHGGWIHFKIAREHPEWFEILKAWALAEKKGKKGNKKKKKPSNTINIALENAEDEEKDTENENTLLGIKDTPNKKSPPMTKSKKKKSKNNSDLNGNNDKQNEEYKKLLQQNKRDQRKITKMQNKIALLKSQSNKKGKL